jgi:hypothetical protein
MYNKDNKDVAGFNGTVTFIGVVEDRKDPQEQGRIKVRIFGVHNQDKNLVPTSALPWAQIALPTNGPRTASLPRDGEWVVGYFLDGKSAQQPLVNGILPGINTEVVMQPAGAPVAPSYSAENKPGQPSVPLLARAIKEGTGIEFSDNNRDHACDVSLYIRRSLAKARFEAKSLIKVIRAAYRKLLDFLGITPSASGMADFLKDVARRIKELNDWLTEKVEAAAEFLQMIREIRAVIEYILSLPAKLAEIFAQCLREAYAELKKGLYSLASDFSLGESSEGLSDSFRVIQDETTALLRTTQTALDLPNRALSEVNTSSRLSDSEKEELVLSLYNDSVGQNFNKEAYASKVL